MFKIIFITFIIMGLFHQNDKTIHKEYDNTGALISEGRYKKGKKNNLWIYYWGRNNKIRSRVMYKNGIIHGKLITYWYPSGNIESIHKYKNGIINGIVKKYWDNHNLHVIKL